MASTDLVVGDQAVISNPNGTGANLRSDATLDDSTIIMELAQGTPVTVVEGPLANDFGVWYWVNANDGSASGYVEASLLVAGEQPATEETATEPATEPTTEPTTEPEATGDTPATLPWQDPVEFGIVVDDNNDISAAGGLACRVDASLDAEIITRLPVGTTSLEVVGARVWVGDTSFVQVNCGTGSGFVNGVYVQLPSEQATEVATELPTEEVIPTEVVTEEVLPTEVPTEEVVPTEVVTEEVVPTEVVTEEVLPTEVVTEEVVPTETVTEEIVPTEVVTEVPTEDVPVETVVPTEVVETVVPTEVVETEAPTETEVVATEVVIVTPAETVVTETEAPTETQIAESATPTDEATDTAGTPTAEVTATATADVTATPDATGTVTATATTEANSTPATPTAEATTTPATVAPTPVTAGPAADISKMIGSAEVTGSNGDGIRCRVAPGTDSPTIMVLPEGTKVYVLAEAVDGWLKIACGGQEGFADVNYLWSGGASDDELPKTAGSTIVVSGTGNGLNCRTGPGTNNPVITVLFDGTTLKTRSSARSGWIPVICGGASGWVSTPYVEPVSTASSPAKAVSGAARATTRSRSSARARGSRLAAAPRARGSR
jgi:uncharacterized protein YraI